MPFLRVTLMVGLAAGVVTTAPPEPKAPSAPPQAPPARSKPSLSDTLPKAPAVPRVRSAISHLLELHNWLQAKSLPRSETPPEYRTEVEAYRAARELAPSGQAWQILSDACAEGPDIAAVKARMASLPAGLPAPEAEAARKATEALASAWPRYEASDLMRHNRSLQKVLAESLRRSFGEVIEPSVMGVLYQTMGFEPLKEPITLYPVVDAAEMGAWGRTSRGWYVVVPVMRRSNLVIVEGLIHELTHLLESGQAPGQRTLQRRVRERAGGAPEETVDAFLHGLVTWNAGELLRRHTRGHYTPLTDLSGSLRESVSAWRPIYEASMGAWIEGRISFEEAVAGLTAALRPQPAPART